MDLLVQLQADQLGVPVRRPSQETTALGAAYLAGLAEGVWADPGSARRDRRVGNPLRAGRHPGRCRVRPVAPRRRSFRRTRTLTSVRR